MYERAPLPLRVAGSEVTSQRSHCGWRTVLLLLSLLLSHPQAAWECPPAPPFGTRGVVHNRDSPEGCPCSRSRSNIQVLCVSQLLKHTAERICRSWSTTGTHVWNIFDDKCELIKGQWLNKYMLQPLKLLPSLRERRSRRKPALSHPTALLWAVATLLCLPLYNLPLLDRGQPDPSSILVSASKSMQWLQPSESPWALTASWSAPFPQADH